MWNTATTLQIQQSAEGDGVTVTQISLADVTQKLADAASVDPGFAATPSGGRRLQATSGGNSSLEMYFTLAMSYSSSADPPPSLSQIFQAAFDTKQERADYLRSLAASSDAAFSSAQLAGVQPMSGSGAPAAAPAAATTPTSTEGTEGIGGNPTTASSGGNGGSGGIIAGVVVGLAILGAAIIGLIIYKKSSCGKGGKQHSNAKTKEGETPSTNGEYNNGGPPSNSQPQRWTNEILVDPSADDVSTLGGSVLAGLNLVEGGVPHGEDEPTASVNLDYDYNRNQYRSDAEERSRSHMTELTGPTAFTNYSKLGMNGESVFADDVSFEKQYALDEDEEDDNHNHSNKLANRVKPFEVLAPPGKLGMVVDTPNGGVPVVRAIKPDSVLMGRVLIGDRLISVDHQDVTSMTALDVSSLISVKQHQQRLLVFCRLAPAIP